MARENVPTLMEEVVAEERKPRPVGEHDRSEVGVDGDDLRTRPLLLLHIALQPPSIGEDHTAVFQQPLEDADNLQRGLVGLVDHDHTPFSAGRRRKQSSAAR
eukprot:144053-Hanusia_phi.AAC.1